MKALGVASCYFLVFLSIAQSWPPIFDRSTTQELCNLGCECPPKGQNYIFLNCGSKSIQKLPSNIYFNPVISRVSFKGNNIVNLKRQTFYKAYNVEELDLSLNGISEIEESVFVGFTSLATLSLSHNQLVVIPRGLLNGLYNLRVLTLGYNKLEDISGKVFEPTPDLRELRLRYNHLKSLRDDIFHWLPKLERLDLENTGLTILSPQIFVVNRNIQWLSLADNSMVSVPSKALQKVTNLTSLDLSGNPFVTLPSRSFAAMSSVLHLNMNSLPRLKSIGKDAFSGLTNLKSLSCSNNAKLDTIHPEAFGVNASIPHDQLYLQNNGLRSLSVSLTRWEKKTYVDLRDNPWFCDCKLQWMVDFRFEIKNSIRCKGPSSLKERPLSTVLSDDMTCPEWLFSTTILLSGAIIAFIMCLIAAGTAFCPRSCMGLYIRSHPQFKYKHVVSHRESVDLEWDPSAEIL